MLKHFKDRLPGAGTTPSFDLEQFIIYRCVVGSRAYGHRERHGQAGVHASTGPRPRGRGMGTTVVQPDNRVELCDREVHQTTCLDPDFGTFNNPIEHDPAVRCRNRLRLQPLNFAVYARTYTNFLKSRNKFSRVLAPFAAT